MATQAQTTDETGKETAAPPEAPESDESIGPHPLSRRRAALESIDRERLRLLNEDAGPDDQIAAEADEDLGESGPDQEVVDDKGEEPEGEGAEKEPVASSPPEEELHEVTVDGEVRQVTLSELKRGFQIESTARNNLEVANRVLEQVRTLEERLRAGTDPATGEPVAQEETATPAASGSDPLSRIDWEDLGKTLQYADPAEAGSKLRETVRQIMTSGPQLDPEQIRQDTINHIEWAQSVRRFRENYSDIIEDPYLSTMAGNTAQQIFLACVEHSQKTGRAMPSFDAIWDEAGNMTRAWVDRLADARSHKASEGDGPQDSGKASTNGHDRTGAKPSVAMSSDRAETKRAAPKPLQPRGGPAQPASTGSTSPPSEADQLKERRSAIADMARARGQIR